MALVMFHLQLITEFAPSFRNSSWAGTRVSHSVSRSKKVFLANVSPQLIDLSLEKGWYVSLQIPSSNDLKLDAELYKGLFG